MNLSSAYFLVIHGSRDSKVKLAASQLKQLVSFKLSTSELATRQNHLDFNSYFTDTTTASSLNSLVIPLMEIAPLELGTSPLHESLIKFSVRAIRQGFERIKVIPLFLAPGVHVTEDIPAEIALAVKQINHRVTIELSPYLGKYSEIVNLLEAKFARLPAGGRILMAHGSRLPAVIDRLQVLGKQLQAAIAYWSVEPSLSQQVAAQVATGHQQIGILPYFLFSGKITERIASEVADLQTAYPAVDLVVGEPLSASVEVAELIVSEIINSDAEQVYR